jgi:hypothetical protein
MQELGPHKYWRLSASCLVLSRLKTFGYVGGDHVGFATEIICLKVKWGKSRGCSRVFH